MAINASNLRHLRPVPDPIPWFVRAGYNDHKILETRLLAGESRIGRAVLDAAHIERHSSLMHELRNRGAEVVLDPRSAELALPIGRKDSLQRLPWSNAGLESDPARYDKVKITTIAQKIAETAATYEFSAVLAPTHYLDDENPRWANIDVELTWATRHALDALGGRHIRLYYPMLIPYGWLRTQRKMQQLAGLLSTIPVNAVWLRVSNFENDKSSAAVRNYIEGARKLLSSDRPLIADCIGGLSALAILAFGAAGGISHGIGVREGFKVLNWQKPSQGSFGPPKRVYSSDTDMFMDQKTFDLISSNPILRHRIACKDKECCPRGVDDMFGNTKTHMINSRYSQLSLLNKHVESLRPSAFIRQELIPIGANLMKLDHALSGYPDLQRRIQRKRRFVDDLRLTLENMLEAENVAHIPRSTILRKVSTRKITSDQLRNERPTL